MSKKDSSVYFSNSLQEALASMKNIPGIQPVAGGTGIIQGRTERALEMPEKIVTLTNIPELATINKTERYIEFGSVVTIREILNLGEKNIPAIFYKALKSIGNPAVRALATIGGNIAQKRYRYAAFAPLLALDAKIEIRHGADSKWFSLNRYFTNNQGEETQAESYLKRGKELITKIRIPTEHWDISIFQRTGKKGLVTQDTGFFVFLARSQKNILNDLRVAWTSGSFFRSRDFENLLIGKTLPLSEKEISSVIARVEDFLPGNLLPQSYKRRCFFNFLENAFRMLAL